MNLILFERDELGKILPSADRRAQHIRQVLHLEAGDSFDAGIVNGASGKAKISAMGGEGIEFDVEFTREPEPVCPLSIIIGFPRPIQARRILKDLTTLGVRAIRFVGTEKGEKSYRDSTLWNGEYLQYVREGAEQAFSTRLPEVTFHWGLDPVLRALPEGEERIALDNEEPDGRLSGWGRIPGACVLAVGSERGWSDVERSRLRAAGFRVAGLGNRVLRTETACLSAVTLVLAAMGRM